jgi:hypothetical protein
MVASPRYQQHPLVNGECEIIVSPHENRICTIAREFLATPGCSRTSERTQDPYLNGIRAATDELSPGVRKIGSHRRRKRCNQSKPYNSSAHDRATLHQSSRHRQSSDAGPHVYEQPKAPNNTTQFLIQDREQRQMDMTPPIPAPRARCYSLCTQGQPYYVDSSDDSGPEDEEDQEFKEACRNVELERIEGMSRDRVNREILEFEKDNRHLLNRLISLKSENQRLKELLNSKGIIYDGQHGRSDISVSSANIP